MSSRVALLAAAGLAAAATLPATTARASSPPSLAILASYQMSETPGSTVLQDSSGNGIDGVIGAHVVGNGATHYFAYLKPNTPPADPEHIDQVASNRLNPGVADYSITFTARWTAPFGNIMQKGQANVAGGRWKLQVPKGIVQCLFQGSAGQVGVGSGRPLNDGAWHTVTCARSSAGVTMWVDGVQVAHKNGPTGNIANKTPMTMGGKPDCDQVTVTCDYFNGEIDSVVIATGSSMTVPGPPTSVSATAGVKSASVTWAAPSSTGGAPITGYTATSAPGGRTCSTSGDLGCIVTGLVDGTPYTFTVRASNQVGESQPSQPSAAVVPFSPDVTPPSVTMNRPLISVTLGRTMLARWQGHDAVSGVKNFDARYRVATSRHKFSTYRRPSSWQATTARSVALSSLRAGSTYCISARSRDEAGNVSAWSEERCVARALDDRAMSASPAWRARSRGGYYQRTIESTRHMGARLTVSHARAERVALVATTCRGCGTVEVRQDGVLLKRIDLRTARTVDRAVFTVSTGMLRAGSISVLVTSVGMPVKIDGIATVRG